MAKIAIVCDNYKLDKFKQSLNAKGIIYAIKGELIKGTTSLVCLNATEETVQSVVDEVNNHFINQAKKKN